MDYKVEEYKSPFNHWIIDNFFPPETVGKISKSFLDYDDSQWWNYSNPLENKKTLQDWRKFPPEIYQTFQHLCSSDFIGFLKEITGIKKLYPDYGLHGGGLHIHGTNGNLNIHKDYSIHPKLKLQRKLNLIIYLSENWSPEWGGGLQFWSHNNQKNKPDELVKTIDCLFNKAVLFDTTQNSWHGLPEPLQCPQDNYRKSIAVYYMTDIDADSEERYRAQFVPRKDQESNLGVINLCEERSKL